MRTHPEAGDPSDTGAAAVEFAIVLPILILLVFGIIEFGRAFNAKIQLTGAVREGARALALGKSNADATQKVKDAAPTLKNPEPAVTVNKTCPNSDDRAEISATYSINYNIPLFKAGTWTLDVKGVMRCGV